MSLFALVFVPRPPVGCKASTSILQAQGARSLLAHPRPNSPLPFQCFLLVRCHNAATTQPDRDVSSLFCASFHACMRHYFFFFQLRLGKFGKGRAKLYMCGTKCRESSDDFHAIASHHHTPFCLHGRSKLAVGPNLCRVVPLVW